MSKMNIAVFFGSRSCEHDVSIVSALQCIEATKAAGFNVTPVYISRDGLWLPTPRGRRGGRGGAAGKH